MLSSPTQCLIFKRYFPESDNGVHSVIELLLNKTRSLFELAGREGVQFAVPLDI